VGVGGVLKMKMIDSQESSFVSSAELWNKLYRLQTCRSFRRTRRFLYNLMVTFNLESGYVYLHTSIYTYTYIHMIGHNFRSTLLNKQL
jgi:hypothetical protein